MTDELIVLIGLREIGRVRRGKRGRLSFAYNEAWREATNAYPLSLSMPLAAREHGPDVVEPFLWNLLPDDERVLDRWARKFQVSPRDVFALIGRVGEDCAGAAQFVRPEREQAVLSGSEDKIEWLSEKDVAARLRALREDHAAWRMPRDTGQFSLAGAQPKTALLLQGGRWGIPSGRIPTTHLLKPPTGQFDGHAENEHFCLNLFRAFGVPAAHSQVMRFENEIAIVIERYDRVRQGNDLIRVHQEDSCQALGVLPSRKYQNEGGPGIFDIVDLLRTHSSAFDDDINTFVCALVFNWIIAGTDAHAKNYSFLISSGPRVRLAPLYDIASVLPYDEFDIRQMKLSMKIGGEYHLDQLAMRHWLRLAHEARLDPQLVTSTIRIWAERVPSIARQIAKQIHDDGLDAPIIDRLVTRLTERAEVCRSVWERG